MSAGTEEGVADQKAGGEQSYGEGGAGVLGVGDPSSLGFPDAQWPRPAALGTLAGEPSTSVFGSPSAPSRMFCPN